MFLSLNWLKQYLPEGINLSDEELQERVNVSLTEVETIYKIGDKLDKIVPPKAVSCFRNFSRPLMKRISPFTA